MDIRKMLSGVDANKIANQGIKLVKDNLPKIFAVTGMGCFGMAIYESIKATHKSDMDIAKEEERRAAALPLYENSKLTKKEKFDLCWPNYIKTALYTAAGVGFSVASEWQSDKKYLALMSAYELSKKAGEERQSAELDILGEDKAKEIDQVVRQRMAKNVDVADGDIQSTQSDGEKILFLEPFTNTPVYATYEDILHAFNQVNHRRHKYGQASINDLLEALSCRKSVVAADWGWNEDQDMVEPVLDNTVHVDDDPTKPATVIGYSIEPQFDFGSDKNQWRM